VYRDGMWGLIGVMGANTEGDLHSVRRRRSDNGVGELGGGDGPSCFCC
jgi:hypothetical protein